MESQNLIFKLSKPIVIQKFGFEETITEIDLDEKKLSFYDGVLIEIDFTILEKKLSETLIRQEGESIYPAMARRTSSLMVLAFIKRILDKKYPKLMIDFVDFKEKIDFSDFMKIIILRECEYFVKLNEIQEMLLQQGLDLVDKFAPQEIKEMQNAQTESEVKEKQNAQTDAK